MLLGVPTTLNDRTSLLPAAPDAHAGRPGGLR
jgi:hypothetical protein